MCSIKRVKEPKENIPSCAFENKNKTKIHFNYKYYRSLFLIILKKRHLSK